MSAPTSSVKMNPDLFFVYAPIAKKQYRACDLTVGISENDLYAITVIPNPISGALLLARIIEVGTVTVYDIQGKLLKEYLQVSNARNIDISEFSIGLYFLKFQNESGSKTFKIIRE